MKPDTRAGTTDLIVRQPHPGSLRRRFLLFMLPVLLDTVLQSLSGTIGNVYVGRLLGPRDLAAAVSFYPLLLLLISCAVGLGTGASILIGQNWGAGLRQRAQAIAAGTLGIGTLLGCVIAGGGQVVIRPILELLSTPPDVFDHATRYAAALLWGTPGLFLVVITGIMLRGAGDSVRPLVMMVVQIMTSLLLTPFLIKGVLGFPPLGLPGAAWAAVAGWGVALIVVSVWLRLARHELAPDIAFLRALYPDRKTLLPVLRLGLPTMMEIMMMGLAEMALISRINAFGSDMTAAYGLFMQALTYIEYPGMAVGITVSVLCAQAIGARDEAEARAVLRMGFQVALLVTGVLACFVLVAPWVVASLFTGDAHVITIAAYAYRVALWSAIPLALSGVLASAMRASGDVVAPMTILLGTIVFVELPVGYLGAHLYGAPGVWVGYPASFCSMLLFIGIYWAVRWRHRDMVPMI